MLAERELKGAMQSGFAGLKESHESQSEGRPNPRCWDCWASSKASPRRSDPLQ